MQVLISLYFIYKQGMTPTKSKDKIPYGRSSSGDSNHAHRHPVDMNKVVNGLEKSRVTRVNFAVEHQTYVYNAQNRDE